MYKMIKYLYKLNNHPTNIYKLKLLYYSAKSMKKGENLLSEEIIRTQKHKLNKIKSDIFCGGDNEPIGVIAPEDIQSIETGEKPAILHDLSQQKLSLVKLFEFDGFLNIFEEPERIKKEIEQSLSKKTKSL